MKRFVLFSLLIIAGYLKSSAQNAQLDSPIKVEESYLHDDTVHLKLLTKISGSFINSDCTKSIEYSSKAVSIARAINHQRFLAENLDLLSHCHIALGESESALEEIREATVIYERLKDDLGIANCKTSLARYYSSLMDFETSDSLYHEAIAIYSRLNRSDKLYSCYSSLGRDYCFRSDFRQALKYTLIARNIAETILHDTFRQGYSMMYMGEIYFGTHDYNNALKYYMESVRLYEIAGNKFFGAQAKTRVGITLFNMNDTTDQALQYYFEALDEYRMQQNQQRITGLLYHIAENLYYMNDSTFSRFRRSDYFAKLGYNDNNQYDLALTCLYEAIDLADKYNVYYYKGQCYYLIGEINRYYENFNVALNYAKLALTVADSVQDFHARVFILGNLSEIYKNLEKYDSAYYYYKEMIAQRDSIENVEIKNQLARKEAEYEFSIKEKDLLHQKELSDVAAASANTELQRQLLLARTREQEILLKDRALEIGQKEKEMQHLAYLKKMAELDVVKLEKQDKDKQLSLTKQSFALQNLKLSKRELERNLLIAGVALSLLSIFLIFRNYRNQRKANLKQQQLNALVSEANEELNVKNTELASTLDDLRTTQAQLVETEKLKENEVIRRRISQDIHDDISSGLTRISWLSELAKEKAAAGKQQEANNALEKILVSSRETVDRLGEIVWAINPDRDNLEGFFAYLRTYVVKFFEDTPFKVTLDFPEKKPDLKFNPDLKRTLFLVVKEALHNVAKHSKASRVAVAFHCPDHRYSITITDDGKGFDVAATQLKGNGLKNMQKRMESVGGIIEIDSRPEKGTVVNLTGEVYN